MRRSTCLFGIPSRHERQGKPIFTRSILADLILWILCCQAITVVSAAASATSSPASVSEKPSLVDLSYLHRTKSSLLARAIQEALLQDAPSDLDLDVSASFVEKSVQDLVSSLVAPDAQPTARRFGIIAQHNQFTNKEATLLLEAILGPEKDEKKKDGKEKVDTKKSKRSKKRQPGEDAGEVISTGVANDRVEQFDAGTGAAANDGNATSVTIDGNVTLSNETKIEQSSESDTTLLVNVSESSEDTIPSNRLLAHSIVRLDLGWNDLGDSSDSKTRREDAKAWHQILQQTIQSWERCPNELRFQVCGLSPAACRAIGKGLMARYDQVQRGAGTETKFPPQLSLYLTRNEAIGDPGVAALSAAIRTIASKHKGCTVFASLDLSGCGVTDTGAEALAIALEQNPLCIHNLDLSNNEITNNGAAALGRALAQREGDRCGKIKTLDLSNNKGIEDSAAKALAVALGQGTIDRLVLRSCHIRADGAAALVKALKVLALSKHRPRQLKLDLSGNPLGILRKKPKSSGGKYSATALRSKATATTAAYMNLIGKTVQKGLKDLGIAEGGGPDTLESDDEEESQSNGKEQEEEDSSKVKCGALAIADAFFLDDEEVDEEGNEPSTERPTEMHFKVELGLRHCAFDTRASEALAAVRQELRSSPVNMDVLIDVRMNNVLEEDTVSALRGDPAFESDLSGMAERYLEAMETLRRARERSLQAAKTTQSRMRAEQEMEDAWGAAVPMEDIDGFDEDDVNIHEDGWDSDEDYDEAEDIEDFY